MGAAQTIGVTYTGGERPFVDRIYRSRLSFEPGQTRELPADLAAKFLRHQDVFQPAGQKDDTATPKKDAQKPAGQKDDTDEKLEAAKKAEEERRAKENARFELHQQIDKMDKQALRDYAKEKFGHGFVGNVGEAKMREQVKGLIDQFGAP
jgi:hypothetical protein